MMIWFLILFSDSAEVEVPAFLENPWFLAMLGWVIYNLGKLWVDQKKYDLNNDGLGLSEVGMYIKFNWVGGLLSLLLLPFLLPYTHDIWNFAFGLFKKDVEFINLGYGLISFVMIGIQVGVKYVKNKFSKK